MPLEIDDYSDYLPVGSPSELFGAGRRIYTAPMEDPVVLPAATIALGTPQRPFFHSMPPIDAPKLQVVKIPNAIVQRGKFIVDSDRRSVLRDSSPVPRPPVEVALDDIYQGAAPIAGYSLHAASRHEGYGHITLEALSSLWCLEEVQHGVNRVLMNRKTRSYRAPLLRALGIDETNGVVSIGGRAFLCQNLILPSQSYLLNRAVSARYLALMRRIRDHVVGADHTGPARIYVSRRFAPKRRLVQEPEIEALFESLGFQIVYPEHTPLVDQIRLFASASCVAGTVGSGLYNVVYSRPGTQRIILAPDRFFTVNDLLLSAGLGAAPTYLLGTSEAETTDDAMFADWSIDVSAVKKLLPDLVSSRPERETAKCY